MYVVIFDECVGKKICVMDLKYLGLMLFLIFFGLLWGLNKDIVLIVVKKRF